MNFHRYLIAAFFTASLLTPRVAQAGRIRFPVPKKAPTHAPHTAPHVDIPPARPHVPEPQVAKPHSEESFLSDAARAAIEPAIQIAIEQVKASKAREDKQFYVEDAFRELQRWHRDITARRVALNLNDQQAVQAFNQEAARYHAALAAARRALATIPAPG